MGTNDTIVATGAAFTIPGYHIQKVLGTGAMGKVYLATQKTLERPVAIKVIAPAYSVDEEFRLRFINEGKIIAQLRHPHIVMIYDIGEFQGHYFMAMEYVGHGTLKERIVQGMSPQQAVKVLRQMADALAHAHRRGFIHRDIKPANILFRDDDTAVLSDFGIAKATEDSAHLTATGLSIGTLLYMSPEQAQAKPLDGRSDLYSLGLVFFEMLAGRRPDRTEQGLIEPLPEPFSRYQSIVEKLLAINPDKRFASAEQCIAALDVLNGTSDLEIAQQATEKTPTASRRGVFKTVWFSAALLVLVLLGGLSYFFWQRALPSALSVDVAYSYRFANQTSFRPLLNGGALHSGDHYRIRLTPDQDGFVYIFQIDSSGAVYRLFPIDGSEGQASGNVNPVRAEVVYFVPSQDRAFQLDEQTGQEKIYVLAFRDRKTELENQYALLMDARQTQNQVRMAELQAELKRMLRESQAETAIPVLTFEHLARGDHAI